ncbi:MAG: CoA-binding protein [Acidobacteria bacterium]|nr:CoA-binding protein [Acidobacteriota bacterium]
MFGPVSEGMRLFRNRASVAVVGYSEKPTRVSNRITRYLVEEGNPVVGINPKYIDKANGITVISRLSELSQAVDIIQVFRNSSALQDLANEILALKWKPKLVWCQQGVVDVVFQKRLEKYGIPVVMDACPYALRSYL